MGVVFLPLVGSVIFKLIPRALDWQGDSPLGISWLGSFELAGLILGAALAAIVVFARPRQRT